ncbi:hypothetical protein E4N72_06725 [Treponema vincentii]|nr:hypothetical protein E4N72_06725 [Treponema vincentii]
MLRKSMAGDGGKATAFAPSSSPPGGIRWAGFLFTEGAELFRASLKTAAAAS